ncbi:class I ribonucleotide reductase maintenance protein YfaE [Agarivorans sp. 1_MG-2023]|uniref:class I ribonucleotide reductase maintenance protein YfaE n=1 Tax=Agarivorans sp. 1_MG-2023 TaxID=3062634 RepID=UPI0026E3582B|nr:class I ribonucleotide reductase maintenance protein YfaE [Agarivorans sp. 1_MG-2023]MDO6764728.1 class I ribonucleotide reductase maintenance protein YfaE [Agarivorans sp. 1_MG-2023]
MSQQEGRVIAGGVEVVVDGHHKSILEAYEQAGFTPEFHCREGVCGACRTTLVKGEVEYTQSPLANIPKGQILSCCSKPKGTIEVAELPPIKQKIA